MGEFPGVLTDAQVLMNPFQPLPGEYPEGLQFFSIRSTHTGVVIGYSATVIGHPQPGTQPFVRTILDRLKETDILKRVSYEIHIPVLLGVLENLVYLVGAYSQNFPPHRFCFDIVDPESIFGHQCEKNIRQDLKGLGYLQCEIAFKLNGFSDNFNGALSLHMNYAVVQWGVQNGVAATSLYSFLDSSRIRYLLEGQDPVRSPYLYTVLVQNVEPVSQITDPFANRS